MGTFERGTAVVAEGDGSFACEITREWWIVTGPNGGYVAAVLVRALEAHLGVADPPRPLRSLSIHYPRAPREGPGRVKVTTERVGGSVTFATMRLTQGDRLCALAQAALAVDREAFDLAAPPAPRVPPPESVETLPDRPEAPAFAANFEFRPTFGSPPFSGADEARSGGWLRLRDDGRDLDAALVAALCDSWLPAVFVTADGPLAVPTLDLTVHLRGRLPAPGDWVLGLYETRSARDGTLDEDATLWSREGELLAQSRQLALAL